MKAWILAPLGRAEPDEVQGWLEHGGGLGLQVALGLTPAALRARLDGVQRRDGRGLLQVIGNPPATVRVALANPIHQLLAGELPAFVLEGALVWARACEQPTVTIVMERDSALWQLWQNVVDDLRRWGILGTQGVTGIEVHLTMPDSSLTLHAIDALTARLLPAILWERADLRVTLLKTEGRFGRQTVHEIPLGLSIRDFVFKWAGGIPTNGVLSLGERILERHDWNLPLTYEQWGADLGAGVLVCL